MERDMHLCLENKLAVSKVDLALVLALGDAGALVLNGRKEGEGGERCQRFEVREMRQVVQRERRRG